MDYREAATRAMRRLLQAGGARAESIWTPLRDGRLHHLEAGTGPPVVLLHGGTGGGANWFRQIGPLSSRYRVLAPDLPGFGLSDPVAPAAPLGRAAAGIILEWLEANGVRDALLVGTSFGGLTAVRVAQAAPRGRVSRLLLLDSAGLGRRIHPALRLAAATPLTSLAVRPTVGGTRQLLRRLLTSRPDRLSAVQLDALVGFLYTTGLRAGTWYLVRTLRLFVGARGQREILTPDELAALSLPVSIVWGEADRMLPVAHAVRTALRMPDATVRILPDVGHSPNWEDPVAVLDAIDHLADRTPARLA
jgi:pimeloyl-ACP methyl ester carboxylesterase